MNENPFNDYCIEAHSFYEEDNNSDLESRLYANIYYTSVETDAPNESSVSEKIPSTNTENANDTTVLNNSEQHETSANKYTTNDKGTGRDVCQSLQQDNAMHNELDKTVHTNSMQVCNVNDDPYAFDANIEDQNIILPMNTKKKRKRKKESADKIKQSLLNFVFKTPNPLQAPSNVSRASTVSNNRTHKKRFAKLPQREQDTENVFTKYKGSKQVLNKVYTEKHKEIEEMNTKYSVLEKKDKGKLQDIGNSNAKNADSDSDSDQSILEVPIPPKPQPPLINLNDSDEEIICTSNDDVVIKKTLTIENCNTADFRDQVKKALSRSQSALASVNECENTNFTDDIVLNCTEVQKVASSIQEIKEMRKDVQKKKKESSKIDNNKRKSERKNANANNQALGNEDNVINEEASNNEINESETNSENANVDYTEDIFPADKFIMSQNKLMANKRRQSQCQDNVKRVKKTGASTNNVHSEKKKNRDKTTNDSYFQPMSDKLKAFYSNSRGQENFDVNEIQSKMSKDPRLWAILDADIRPKSKKQRFWDVKCTHCHQYGHARYNCPEPRKPPKCYMCGVQGHTEVRCPQKMCLTCGKRQGAFRKTCEACRTLYCVMCSAVGHNYTECPDLWRRYHQTTTTNDISTPSNVFGVMKPADRLFCCNCTKRGHDSSTCKDYRWSQHFPTPAHVSNYTDGPSYTKEQSQSMDNVQCFNDLNAVQSQDSATNEQHASNVTTVKCSDDIYTFPQELIKMKRGKVKGFPQNMLENYSNISYVIYQCGDFYTFENNGIEVTYNITAKREFNTYSLMKCNVVPHFLEMLLGLFKFEVKIYKEISSGNEIVMRVRTFVDYMDDLCRLILYWLSLDDDEKTYAMSLDLPLERTAMIDLLKSNIEKVGPKTKTVFGTHGAIESLKRKLTNARDAAHYENLLYDIENRQRKLLLTLSDFPKLRKFPEEIRQHIRILEQSRSETVPVGQYLQIISVYNYLFIPHTPTISFLHKWCKNKNPVPVNELPYPISKIQTPKTQQNPMSVRMNNRYKQDFQSTSNNTTNMNTPMAKVTKFSSNHVRFDDDVFEMNYDNTYQNNTLEYHGTSEYNNPSETAVIRDDKNNDDFVLHKGILQYDSTFASHDYYPINTSADKYTNITVNVSDKDQVDNANSFKSNMNNFQNEKSQNINKCTNITLNVSNKNHTSTTTNFKSHMNDSINDKFQNTNKYTNITVSVSNKNQTRTVTNYQSNIDNSKNNKHQNSNKCTNITVSVSDKDQPHTAVSTSHLNKFKNDSLQSNQINNLKINQSNDDDVMIEANNKAPNLVQKQNNQAINNKNGQKEKKKGKNKGNNFRNQGATETQFKLKELRGFIKKELAVCSPNNPNHWKKFMDKIVTMMESCKIAHLKEAANTLKYKQGQQAVLKKNVYMFLKLVNIEMQHEEQLQSVYNRFQQATQDNA